MRTEQSRLTTKYQATIPEGVRKVMHLQAGDVVAFDIHGETVTLRKASPVDLAFTQALEETLSEWTTEQDEAAYRDL